MRKDTVLIPNDGGPPSVYRRLAARVPEFLEQYSPSAGYGVDTEFTDLLSLRPGMMELLARAVSSNTALRDLGIPHLEFTLGAVVCRAKLLDSAGRAIQVGTACEVVQGNYDMEILESSARQRLLAAVGFGGEILSQDEEHHWSRHGTTVQPTLSGGAANSDNVEAMAASKEQSSATLRQRKMYARPDDAGPIAESAATPALSDVKPALQATLKAAARRAGVTVPAVQNDEEAQRELKRLGALGQARFRADEHPTAT